MLKLPLWFVTDKESQDTLAFSDINRLRSFMLHSGIRAEDITVANDRDGLIAVVADAHMRGLSYVYVDPDSDGHGGQPLLLTDLMRVE